MSTGLRDEQYKLRTELREALRLDLLGPHGGPDEVLVKDAPITVYPVGVLFPQRKDGASVEMAEADGVDTAPEVGSSEDGDQDADVGVALANRRRPSSLGMTFSVDTAVTERISVEVQAARYRPEDELGRPVKAIRTEARSTDEQRERWRRVRGDHPAVAVEVSVPGMHRRVEVEGVELRVLVRPVQEGIATVTVTLVNAQTCGEYDLQDAYCLFQPGLRVVGPDGTRPFVERPAVLGAVDEEQALSRMLHRHAPSFAVGHGCSVAWDWTAPPLYQAVSRSAVGAICTEFIPTHEVLLTESNAEIDDAPLGMLGLSSAAASDIVSRLNSLVEGYGAWIEARRADLTSLEDAELLDAGREQLDQCTRALERMRKGLVLLGDDSRPEILHAFRLANEAMGQQRARAQWIRSGRSGEPDVADGRWRPFQIAFVLQCLAGVVDPEHEDRQIADLLWFPTGGGKTEAYLGLIAFTVFLRRLRGHDDGRGVTVLMRYTLRLLTLQQFERAAALICAMEAHPREAARRARHDDPSRSACGWGVPPRRTSSIERTRPSRGCAPTRTSGCSKENPVQLRACPWCGAHLGPHALRGRSVGLADVRRHARTATCHFRLARACRCTSSTRRSTTRVPPW